MTDYRRNFVPGGSFFVTVNLGQRNARLLTEHVGLLRAAFRYTRARHPFAIDAIVVLPDYLHTIWTCPRMTPISPRAGGSSNQGSPAPCRQPSGSPKPLLVSPDGSARRLSRGLGRWWGPRYGRLWRNVMGFASLDPSYEY